MIEVERDFMRLAGGDRSWSMSEITPSPEVQGRVVSSQEPWTTRRLEEGTHIITNETDDFIFGGLYTESASMTGRVYHIQVESSAALQLVRVRTVELTGKARVRLRDLLGLEAKDII